MRPKELEPVTRNLSLSSPSLSSSLTPSLFPSIFSYSSVYQDPTWLSKEVQSLHTHLECVIHPGPVTFSQNNKVSRPSTLLLGPTEIGSLRKAEQVF